MRFVQLTLCWLALVVAVVAGCERSSAPSPQASGGEGTDTATLAAAALERGDYELAARLYRTALGAAPESLVLHYGLGVSATFLDRRPEAIRELTWVLEHGEPGSSEVRGARRWLLSAGLLRARVAAADAAEGQEQSAAEQTPASANVQGTVTLEGVPQERMQVFLMEYPSRIKYFRLRTDERGTFQFKNVPPGVYKLTERAAGNPLWRIRVDLKAGQNATVDLTDTNSTKVRDDFPDSAQPAEPPRSS